MGGISDQGAHQHERKIVRQITNSEDTIREKGIKHGSETKTLKENGSFKDHQGREGKENA